MAKIYWASEKGMKVFQALGRGQGGTRKPLSPRSPSDGDGAELACTDSAPQELTNCSQEGCRGGTAGGTGAQSVARPISREGAWHHGLLPETHLCPPWLAWASALPATTLHMLPSVKGRGGLCPALGSGAAPMPGTQSRLLDLGRQGGFW